MGWCRELEVRHIRFWSFIQTAISVAFDTWSERVAIAAIILTARPVWDDGMSEPGPPEAAGHPLRR